MLHDETFISWLKGEATFKKKKKWDQWLNEDSRHKYIVWKADKILKLPFTKVKFPDVNLELSRLEESIVELSDFEVKNKKITLLKNNYVDILHFIDKAWDDRKILTIRKKNIVRK